MTLSRFWTGAALTTALAAASLPLRADQLWPNPSSGGVVTNHPTLQLSLDRLSARSAKWRDAVKRVGSLGRRAVVVTPKQVKVMDPQTGAVRPFDAGVIAEVQPIAEQETRVDAVVVVVNLDLLERLQRRVTAMGDFEDDLDRILAHEVYGHAFPYLLAGDLSGKCSDPVIGQRAEDACAIKRENEIRSELRLGVRRDSGLNGLTLARPFRD